MASLRQGIQLLRMVEEWADDRVQTLVRNWDLVGALEIALRVGRRTPDEVRAFFARQAGESALGAALLPQVFRTKSLVAAMTRAGYHTVALGPDGVNRGMPASTYRKLWPATVEQPVEYRGRFDTILCVDTTLGPSALMEQGRIVQGVNPDSCTDLVPIPTDKDGQPLKRYIAFVQLGERHLNRKVEDCCAGFATDEGGLVTREGLHLPVEHAAYLKRYACDLAGSRYDGMYAPCVYWFGSSQPKFNADHVQPPNPCYGSASRGSRVVAVR